MLSLGPRARRRVAFLAAVAVAVVVAGVIHHVTNAGGHSSKAQLGDAQPGTNNLGDAPLGEDNLGIAYGDRREQVLRRLGQPNKKRGACWIYNAPDGKVNGIATLQGAGVDGMRFCFAEDATGGQAVEQVEWHYKPATYHGIHTPAHWGQPKYIACNTKHPCVIHQP